MIKTLGFRIHQIGTFQKKPIRFMFNIIFNQSEQQFFTKAPPSRRKKINRDAGKK